MEPTADKAGFQHGEFRDDLADSPDRAEQRWLRTGRVAALFGVDPRTVCRWVNAGVLACVRTEDGQRRFAETEVRALLTRRGQLAEGSGGMLRTGQVARQLGVDRSTVMRWSRQGRLPSIRTVGGHRRYPQAMVDRQLAQPGDPPPPGQRGDDQQIRPASAAGIASQAATRHTKPESASHGQADLEIERIQES